MAITREKFYQRVGRGPINIDLARCNCKFAGTAGHTNCGWDTERDMPVHLPNIPSDERNTMNRAAMNCALYHAVDGKRNEIVKHLGALNNDELRSLWTGAQELALVVALKVLAREGCTESAGAINNLSGLEG